MDYCYIVSLIGVLEVDQRLLDKAFLVFLGMFFLDFNMNLIVKDLLFLSTIDTNSNY